jgi:hypothetical protein
MELSFFFLTPENLRTVAFKTGEIQEACSKSEDGEAGQSTDSHYHAAPWKVHLGCNITVFGQCPDVITTCADSTSTNTRGLIISSLCVSPGFYRLAVILSHSASLPSVG